MQVNYTIEFVDVGFVLGLAAYYEVSLGYLHPRMESNEHIDQLLKLNDQLSALHKLELREQLIEYINYLLLHDFNKLVQILYRIDVDEKKLKELLQRNVDTDAAVIIADLLIERQEEKIRTKDMFKSDNNIADEEKW